MELIKIAAVDAFPAAIANCRHPMLYIPILLVKGIPIFYIPQEALFRVLYAGVFLSGIAYITYMEALKILTASKGAMVFFLKPVIASLLAVIFLGESLSFKTAAGMLLVLSGIFINFSKINLRIGKAGDKVEKAGA